MSIVNRLGNTVVLLVQDIRKNVLLKEEVQPNQIVRFDFKPQILNISLGKNVITTSPSDVNLIAMREGVYNDRGDLMPPNHIFDEEKSNTLLWILANFFIIVLLILFALNFGQIRKMLRL